jgi:hypothetical protein
MSSLYSNHAGVRPSVTRAGTLAAASLALLACASTAIAQPAGVTVTDLGNFGSTVSTTQTRNITLTPAAPVAWFKIRVPRIAPPNRYLDISTSGAGFGDSEIALFAADGTLIAEDDDDGAGNFSALSFGMVTPGAFGRPAPVAEVGQSAGDPNNGRDGTLSGLASIERGGTAGDYYIAVARFDSTFGNNFGVVPPGGPLTLPTLLTVRMDTPGGQVAPTVIGSDQSRVVGNDTISVTASVSLNTTGVSVDLSSIGGPSDRSMSPLSSSSWIAQSVSLSSPLSQIGVFPMTFRASNAIGDVTIDVANVTVRPRGAECATAFQSSPIATTPGTTVYTYTTTLGDVDGPWTNACFTQTPTGNDVWFRFVPTQSGTLTLSTCNADTGATGGQPDTLLGFRGRCDDAGFSTCGDDTGGTCGLGTRLTNIPVTAGLEYNIAVRAWSTDIVDGKLAVTFTPRRCNPADIAYDNGTALPPIGPFGPSLVNNGVTEGDYNLFFATFFDAGPACDIAADAGEPLPPFGNGGIDPFVNNGVTEGDYNLFFAIFFNGCAL